MCSAGFLPLMLWPRLSTPFFPPVLEDVVHAEGQSRSSQHCMEPKHCPESIWRQPKRPVRGEGSPEIPVIPEVGDDRQDPPQQKSHQRPTGSARFLPGALCFPHIR